MSNEDQAAPLDDAPEQEQVTISAEGEAQAASEESTTAVESARIEELEAQLAEAKEQALRAAAEMQNVRRRAEADVGKAHKFALEKFVNDMLPVADNLERAIASSENAETGSLEVFKEGVELTLKTLMDGLGRHKVVAIDPQGEPFDPQLHQAMTMVEQPDSEPNTVINVFQKGYILNERLVRPAMVVVSK